MHVLLRSFLISVLILVWSSMMPSLGAVMEPSTGAEWVASVDEPGPDVPPKGRSLFDHLFTKRVNGSVEYNIPFPFEELTAKIEIYF